MRFIILLALLLAPAASRAQNSAAPSGSVDQIKHDLLEIEKQIGRANFTCDYAYFARVEADEFIFTDSTGGVTTRQQDLAGERDCHKSDFTYDLDETRVLVYGNVGVVNARVTIAGTNKEGKPFTHRSRFTDTFVWRDNRWQLVAGHSSNIPEIKPS
jgi:ketosteroid isomerase-like protein